MSSSATWTAADTETAKQADVEDVAERQETEKEKEKIYTIEELRVLCKKYQKLLRLEDWEINVELVHQNSIPDYNAQVASNSNGAQATISIPTAESFASAFAPKQNMRHALFHELLHLHFVVYFRPDKGSVYERLFEQAMNKIAQALDQLEEEKDASQKKIVGPELPQSDN